MSPSSLRVKKGMDDETFDYILISDNYGLFLNHITAGDSVQ